MNDSLLHGIVSGTDGGVPIYQPDAPWRIFALPEVFVGKEGQGRYVPKVLDYVIDPPTYTMYIVKALDMATFIPVLEEIKPANLSFRLDQSDVLFGTGVGSQAQQMRIYLNKSTSPYSLQVDAFLQIGGTDTAYAKIFRGSDIDVKGEVVSRIYDAAGNFISENVPLELVTVDNHINYALRSVAECKCITDMIDNEVLTVVFYKSNGVMVSKSQLLLEVTDYVKPLNASNKVVSHIDLESPFMSVGNANQIDFPLNLPKDSVNFTGVVYYTDGSSKRYPVDGGRFALMGFDQALSSVEDQTLDLVLRYLLPEGEGSYAPHTVQGKLITKGYTLRVLNPNNSYSVKLHHFPRWNDVDKRYDLHWWLTTMDRTLLMDVTGLVKIDARMGAYDPYLFGTRQRKQVSINLNDVSKAYKPFMHTQIVDVCLFKPPNETGVLWTVCNEGGINHPDYGQDVFALKTDLTKLKIDCGLTVAEDWNNLVYWTTFPLTNAAMELKAPTFTHFVLRYKDKTFEYQSSAWNDELDLGTEILPGTNIVIEFYKRTSSGDLSLSVAEMSIKD